MREIKSITPDPVVNAIVEFRFESDVPDDAVFGVLFNSIRSVYSGLEHQPLPIMQLPEALRSQDPNFKEKPWHQLSGDGIGILIGPTLMAVNCDCVDGYPKWEIFRRHVEQCAIVLEKSGIVKRCRRLGVRFISFFADVNIFDKSAVKISCPDILPNMTAGNASFSSVVSMDGFDARLLLNNGVSLRISERDDVPVENGSIVDIDVFRLRDEDGFCSRNIMVDIDTAHKLEKGLFFSMLAGDFLESLNPEYQASGGV